MSNDSSSSPQQQQRLGVVASAQSRQRLNQTFPVLTLVMIPSAWPPLVSPCFMGPILLLLDSGSHLVFL